MGQTSEFAASSLIVRQAASSQFIGLLHWWADRLQGPVYNLNQ